MSEQPNRLLMVLGTIVLGFAGAVAHSDVMLFGRPRASRSAVLAVLLVSLTIGLVSVVRKIGPPLLYVQTGTLWLGLHQENWNVIAQ